MTIPRLNAIEETILRTICAYLKDKKFDKVDIAAVCSVSGHKVSLQNVSLAVDKFCTMKYLQKSDTSYTLNTSNRTIYLIISGELI